MESFITGSLAVVPIVTSGAAMAATAGVNVLEPVLSPSAYSSYPRGCFVWSGVFAAVPTTGSLSLYFLESIDGTTTNFTTDLGRSAAPATAPRAFIPLDLTNTTQVQKSLPVDLPTVPFKVILLNTSGVAMNAAWTLGVIPETDITSP